jgi:hypothetical protein
LNCDVLIPSNSLNTKTRNFCSTNAEQVDSSQKIQPPKHEQTAAASGGKEELGLQYEYEAMKNFRELLWYWQEYYLRRGRDRLSVEFSCRIPFSSWVNLVGEFG